MNIKNINFKSKRFNRLVLVGICLMMLILAALLIFRSCSSDATKSNMENTYGNYEVTDGRIKYKPKDTGDDDIGYIKFAGYGQYEVSKDQPNIELSNPSTNFTDFVFEVKDAESKKLIGKTGKVPPGKFVYMNVMDFYKTPGVYNVDINISTYDSESGAQLNGVNQKMEITVQ